MLPNPNTSPQIQHIYSAIFEKINGSWLMLRDRSRVLSSSIQTLKLDPAYDSSEVRGKLLRAKLDMQNTTAKLKDLRSRALMLRVNIVTILDSVLESKDVEKLKGMIADLDIIAKSQIYED